MTQSMTAYGRQEKSDDRGEVSCEIKSVNHRYLELFISLPEELRIFEQTLRAKILQRLKRGKIDCNIRYRHYDPDQTGLLLNHVLLDKLIATVEEVRLKLKQAAPVSPLELLRWPGVLEGDVADPEKTEALLLQLLDQTLDDVVRARQREGSKIKTLILDRCQQAKAGIAKIRFHLPEMINHQHEKLKQRLQFLNTGIDNIHLENELCELLQKTDVAEEMDRFDAHLDEVHHILDQAGPSGRRLDFLMQEMNREVNTLGAKSAHPDTSSTVIELKLLIEQMREQAQNIE